MTGRDENEENLCNINMKGEEFHRLNLGPESCKCKTSNCLMKGKHYVQNK